MSKSNASVRMFLVREIEEYCGNLPENVNTIKAVAKVMLKTFCSNQICGKTLPVLYFRRKKI
jgi:hypothetical protein